MGTNHPMVLGGSKELKSRLKKHKKRGEKTQCRDCTMECLAPETGPVAATKTAKARMPMKTWSKTVSNLRYTALDTESTILSHVRSPSSQHTNLTL